MLSILMKVYCQLILVLQLLPLQTEIFTGNMLGFSNGTTIMKVFAIRSDCTITTVSPWVIIWSWQRIKLAVLLTHIASTRLSNTLFYRGCKPSINPPKLNRRRGRLHQTRPASSTIKLNSEAAAKADNFAYLSAQVQIQSRQWHRTGGFSIY